MGQASVFDERLLLGERLGDTVCIRNHQVVSPKSEIVTMSPSTLQKRSMVSPSG